MLLVTKNPKNPDKRKKAKIVSHQPLAKTKASKDTTINDTLSRRPDMFINCQFDQL